VAKGAREVAEATAKGGKASKAVGKVAGSAKSPTHGRGIDRPRANFGTPATAREQLGLMGIGAGLNAGTQMLGASDRTTPGDVAAAALGGALQAAKLPSLEAARGVADLVYRARLVPTAATATTAAIESLTGDILSGRTPSVERAKDAAAMAAIGQRVGERAARLYAHGLSRAEKEKLGEKLSLMRTGMRGEKTRTTEKTKEKLEGPGYWVPDQRTTEGNIEAKFGYRAALTKRQTQARAEGSLNRVDQWTPNHIGSVGSAFGGMVANHLLFPALRERDY
jgi:hypothetical protein